MEAEPPQCGLTALNNKFFKFAYKIAKAHRYGSEKLVSYHCALIVKGGAILSVGVNKSKRNNFVKIHKYPDFAGIHAELEACMKALKTTGNIEGCTIYVLRVLKDGKTIEMSRPCEYCEGAIKSYGIRRIYYTLQNGSYQIENLS